MDPVTIENANAHFHAPNGMSPELVISIKAIQSQVKGGGP